jgi:hypothetical protein
MEIPIRSELTKTPFMSDVIVETLERTGDTLRVQTGVRRGFRRINSFRTVRMPVYDRFVPSLRTPAVWGYAFAASDTTAAAVLALHGIAIDRVRTSCSVAAESFTADSVAIARAAFQNRREVRVEGRWQRGDARLDAGAYVVRVAQPLGVLATYLLDPRSDDGLVTWNVGDRVAGSALRQAPYRLTTPLPAQCGG